MPGYAAQNSTQSLDNNQELKAYLGYLSGPYIAAKKLYCSTSSNSDITENMAKSLFASYDLTVTDFQPSTWAASVSVEDGQKNQFQIIFSAVNGGISINQGKKQLLSDESTPNDSSPRCSVKFLAMPTEYFTNDGRPLKTITKLYDWNSGYSTSEDDYNTPPKSLQQVYGGCSYDGKSFEQIEAINKDVNRIVVAVIDVGLDYDDPIIAYKTNRNEVGLDTVENDFTPSVKSGGDQSGMFYYFYADHGSFVSAIAVKGSDKLELVPIRHDDLDATSNSDIRAIEYASKRGARIVNMSFGDTNKTAMPICSEMALHPEMLFVAATDDSDQNNDIAPVYPASCKLPNLISVGSVSSWNFKSSFSGYGKNSVQIAAHGENVVSSVGYGRTGTKSGTSFAAPQVANVAGKILAINPNLTPEEVISILEKSSSKYFWLDSQFSSGGVLNETAALRIAKNSLNSNLRP